jgi:integration host factor subunit beta
MIKSELVTRVLAQNPHLFQSDIEKIVNAILEEIVAAMAQGAVSKCAASVYSP